ncbi:MAG: hypothetical protein DI543_05060 [Bradyrhizobium icense]|nr:MAG: hypothetical protein DI543_05060 [Bradyrhizobium icense]
MPGLDPGIHALLFSLKNVDGRDEPGHDEVETVVLPHPEERAVARVSKDRGPCVASLFETPLRGSSP